MKNKITNKEIKFLKDNGYLLIDSNKTGLREFGIKIEDLEKSIDKLLEVEGEKAGVEAYYGKTLKKGESPELGVNRLAVLVKKGQIFMKLMELPSLLFMAKNIIQGPFKLSDMEMREPKKNFGRQSLHIDGKVRKNINENANMLVCFLYIDDSNKKNGAIAVVPKSHLSLINPKNNTKGSIKRKPEKIIEAKKGSLLFLDPCLWHRGRTNSSGNRRRVIFINYRSRDLHQQVHMKKYFKGIALEQLTCNQKYLLSLKKSDPNFLYSRFIFNYRKSFLIKVLVISKSFIKNSFRRMEKLFF